MVSAELPVPPHVTVGQISPLRHLQKAEEEIQPHPLSSCWTWRPNLCVFLGQGAVREAEVRVGAFSWALGKAVPSPLMKPATNRNAKLRAAGSGKQIYHPTHDLRNLRPGGAMTRPSGCYYQPGHLQQIALQRTNGWLTPLCPVHRTLAMNLILGCQHWGKGTTQVPAPMGSLSPGTNYPWHPTGKGLFCPGLCSPSVLRQKGSHRFRA